MTDEDTFERTLRKMLDTPPTHHQRKEDDPDDAPQGSEDSDPEDADEC